MIRTRGFKLMDAPRVVEMAQELAEHHGDTSHLTHEFLRHAIARPEFKIVMALKGADAVGFASLQRRITLAHARDFVHIDNIVVTESARREGVGRALIRAAATTAVKTEATGLSLFFRRENALAQRFYEALGFNIMPHNDLDLRAEITGDKLENIARDKPINPSGQGLPAHGLTAAPIPVRQ